MLQMRRAKILEKPPVWRPTWANVGATPCGCPAGYGVGQARGPAPTALRKTDAYRGGQADLKGMMAGPISKRGPRWGKPPVVARPGYGVGQARGGESRRRQGTRRHQQQSVSPAQAGIQTLERLLWFVVVLALRI